MKKFISLLIRATCLAATISGLVLLLTNTPTAASLNGNKVFLYFATQHHLEVYGDSFTNQEIVGQAIWRIPDITNITDETGEPVKDLRVTLESDLAFEWIDQENLVKKGPPIYEWYFGELVEEHEHKGWATDVLVGFIKQSPVTFAPGFDVSRSFDKTVFTTPSTQEVTVTVIPRDESIDSIEIFVHAEENELVSSEIISHSSGEQAYITPDGLYSGAGLPGTGIPVQPNTPVSITVMLQVNPKVPELEYKPHVGIKPNIHSEPYTGTSQGNAVSYTNEAGTWTVSAEGNYIWDWGADKTPGIDLTLRKRFNSPPLLTSGTVSPSSGTSKTPLSFEATYQDKDLTPDSFTPSYVRVYIDGSSKDMSYLSGASYSDGMLFGYTTNLDTGQHSYYFEASDGSFTTRFPESGTLSIEIAREGTKFPVSVAIGIALGLVIAGSIIFFFVRRRS